MAPTIYYIIPTTAIGGAEKRFIELWCHLQQQQQLSLRLIVSQQLLQAIENNAILYQQVQPYANQIITYTISPTLSVFQFQKQLYRFICTHTTSNDVLHFILLFPAFILLLRHRNTIYSLTESSLQNVNAKGRLLYWLSAYRSTLVDVLDPTVYATMYAKLWFKKKQIHHTPGSFVNTSIFTPAINKQPQFVFLGRFFYVKQVVKLMQLLPAICQQINAANTGVHHYSFLFIGYGQQEAELKAIANLPTHATLPITITMSNQPQTELAKSSVLFSLQLRNNYPSKSLLEGLAAGNLAIVTDVGNTRTIAQPAFSYYVPENFTATDIATHIVSILTLSPQQKIEKMAAARQFVQTHCSINASLHYYSNLYKTLT